jgi:uncharacterized protein HemY
MLEILILSFFATVLGTYLASETKKVTTDKQRRRIGLVLNFVFVGLLIVICALVRPYLPKDGVWSVLHTKEEVAQYQEMKELQAQLKAISEATKQYRN